MFACPICRTIQPIGAANSGRMHKCPDCGRHLSGDLFPAFFRPMADAATGRALREDGPSECFNHPGKQAEAICAGCGRLLCALCEIQLDGKSLCLKCLQAGYEKKSIATLEKQRTLYDNMALVAAFWPPLVFFVFPSLITAPLAIFIALRYWKTPLSILPRTKLRYILAMTLSCLQIVGWVIFFVGIFG
jgi:hypothetical protein